jgi:hypothetical protein
VNKYKQIQNNNLEILNLYMLNMNSVSSRFVTSIASLSSGKQLHSVEVFLLKSISDRSFENKIWVTDFSFELRIIKVFEMTR